MSLYPCSHVGNPERGILRLSLALSRPLRWEICDRDLFIREQPICRCGGLLRRKGLRWPWIIARWNEEIRIQTLMKCERDLLEEANRETG